MLVRRVKVWAVAIAAACLLVAAAPVSAESLGLVKGKPDIYAANLNVDYVAESDSLSVSGAASKITLPSGNWLFIEGDRSFDLSVLVDSTGALKLDGSGNPTGTLTIKGTVSDLSASSGTLLTGSISQFGFKDTRLTLEFIFHVTGGDLQGMYGSEAGVILSPWCNVDFGTSFTNHPDPEYPGPGVSDTFARVPEPGTLAGIASLFCVGIAVASRRFLSRRRG